MHWLCKISDSLDLYSMVVASSHGRAKFGHVFIGVYCFSSKRPYS
jgi:hypothetical protein